MSNQNPAQESIHNIAEALRRERDELSLKISLGKMELRDEWHELEEQWQNFERTFAETSDDAKESLHELGRDLAETYERFKSKLG